MFGILLNPAGVGGLVYIALLMPFSNELKFIRIKNGI